MIFSRWQVAGGMWPKCLGAVRKVGIRCPHQLVVEKKRDIAGGGAAGLLSAVYVLMH